MHDIARNIKQIRELKSFTQEYMAQELGISQPAYAKIEQGSTILKIDRLQQIADILEVNLPMLLSTTGIFDIVFQAHVTQSDYTQNNTSIEMPKKINQDATGKNKI
jgi:transcriptional regulator with XRE-family HTH domain